MSTLGAASNPPDGEVHPSTFEDLYASWGIFDLFHQTLDQLDPEWLVIFNIARILLANKPVPGVEVPQSLMDFLNGAFTIEYERRMVEEVTYRESLFPGDSVYIRTNRKLPEIVRALPGQLLLMTVAPTLFWMKAITGSLLIAQPQEPQTVREELRGTREAIVPIIKRRAPPRQKVYILLDASRSMADAHKLTFAKALIFAYLIRARAENAEVYFRWFRTSPSERMQCLNHYELPPLARSILDQRADGSTSIGRAIKVAVDDIDTAHHLERVRDRKLRAVPAEILLISDCASYTGLPHIPQSIKMHTVHLEGGDEQITTPLAYEELVREIRERSETFVRINTAGMEVTVGAEESTAVSDEVRDIEDTLLMAGPERAGKDEALLRRMEQVRRIARIHRKLHQNGNGRRTDSPHLVNSDLAEGLFMLLTWAGLKERMRRAVQQALRTRSTLFSNLRQMNPVRKGRVSGTRFRVRGN